MNEVTLHRGRSPHLNIIDAYVNGQHLTEAVVGSFPCPQALNSHPLWSPMASSYPHQQVQRRTPSHAAVLSCTPQYMPCSLRQSVLEV